MKRLVIVVVVLGVLSAAAAALAAGGRPITEKVLGAASIRSATRDPAGFAHRLRGEPPDDHTFTRQLPPISGPGASRTVVRRALVRETTGWPARGGCRGKGSEASGCRSLYARSGPSSALANRAQRQYDMLERERITAARQALGRAAVGSS